jgi:glycosyltransferase involved in cell wall biosynthesis
MMINGLQHHSVATHLSGMPEAIDSPIVPIDRRPRFITAVHGPLNRSFSGSTVYCGRAAMNEGVMEGAFALTTDKLNVRLHSRASLWKLLRLVQGYQWGGYKYHSAYSDTLWSQYLPMLTSSVLISNTQVLGNYFFANCEKSDVTPCFFIDGTLREYFHGYAAVDDSVVKLIDGDVIDRAIALEHAGYQRAARIFAMSSVTVRTLIDEYGVPASRVSLVLPGANIIDEAVPAPSTHAGWVGLEFTLGFVGLYPLRKGLDKLAEAVRILRSRGAPIRLRVIGNCPEAIAAMNGVDFLGIINKATDLPRFIEAIRAVDLGCQLSRAELAGIAMMEFLRVGVPIIATNIGGIPDMFEDGGGWLVSPDITAEQLAVELGGLMTDTQRYQALRQAAVRRAEWASWRRTARDINEALVGIS